MCDVAESLTESAGDSSEIVSRKRRVLLFDGTVIVDGLGHVQ